MKSFLIHYLTFIYVVIPNEIPTERQKKNGSFSMSFRVILLNQYLVRIMERKIEGKLSLPLVIIDEYRGREVN
jgi:hypothetical protein